MFLLIGSICKIIISKLKRKKMRTKNFIILLTFVILFSVLLIIWGPNGQQNGSLKNIVEKTHEHLNYIKVSFDLFYTNS